MMMRAGDCLTNEFDIFVASELAPKLAWLVAGLQPRADVNTVADLTIGELELFIDKIPNPTTDDGKAFISSCRLTLQALYTIGAYDPPTWHIIYPSDIHLNQPSRGAKPLTGSHDGFFTFTGR